MAVAGLETSGNRRYFGLICADAEGTRLAALDVCYKPAQFTEALLSFAEVSERVTKLRCCELDKAPQLERH